LPKWQIIRFEAVGELLVRGQRDLCVRGSGAD
jgi:hypothetical protein